MAKFRTEYPPELPPTPPPVQCGVPDMFVRVTPRSDVTEYSPRRTRHDKNMEFVDFLLMLVRLVFTLIGFAWMGVIGLFLYWLIFVNK